MNDRLSADASPSAKQAPRVLVLGTAEWDSPIATNQHYVVRELAQSWDVTFVESLGLRRPTLRRQDVARMAARVMKASGTKEAAVRRARPDRASIVSPLVVPVHRAPTFRINRALLRKATMPWLDHAGPKVLWTFTPVTYGLEAAADVVVYHCVDLLAAFPGIDAVAVGRGEARLAVRADRAIATSKAVQDHLAGVGFPHIDFMPNVADVSVFNQHSRPAGQRRPAALFSGNLTVHKLDMPVLEATATALREAGGELVLAGPLAAGGGSFDAELQRLLALGARYLGVLTPQELAQAAGECTVGLIPYALNDYTRGVSPLKAFEYLASGLSVVSTRLPSVAALAEQSAYITAADPADIAGHAVQQLRAIDDDAIADRMASAAQQGWAERGQVLRETLETELAKARR